MTNLASCLSHKLGPLELRVEAFVREYARTWEETSPEPSVPDKIYLASEKKEVEKELSALIDRMSAVQKKAAAEDLAQKPGWMEKAASELRPFFQRLLRRADLKIETVYDSRFVESTQQFLRAAREFDPDIGITSVYQALRNVWIMNTLQFYLGIEAEHTDAIFGYSMVYPYLDNVLDDDGRSTSDKIALVIKLKAWLEGEEMKPSSPQEEKLQALIGMVERQFSRSQFPCVYQSLLAIYNGQIRSLLQQRGTHAPDSAEILDISLEKGGTSVLADGYLVAGALSPLQEDFCFGFGVILQLADDLQDIAEDVERGHMTIFTQSAGQAPLDPLVYRLLHYMSFILEQKLDAGRPREQALQEMIRPNCALMFMESVGKHAAYFSKSCVRDFQRAFPVRFAYLRKIRATIEGRFLTGRERIGDLDPVSAAFLTLSSRIFALD
jgi:hypothetical protein